MVQEATKTFTFDNGSSAVVGRENTGAVTVQFSGVQRLEDVLDVLNYCWRLEIVWLSEEAVVSGPSSHPELNRIFADFGAVFGGAQ